jgi:large subunit ribosomal protein L10
MPAKWKLKEVEELEKKLSESPIIGIAGIEGLPTKQFAQIRSSLHDEVEIKVVKNRLARLAFEKAKKKRKELEELEAKLEGPTALIFTKENPFKLYKKFEDNKIPSVAKPGDVAPDDIVVPAGDTPFKPGPIIGELQKVGIKAKIQGGIIVVTDDSPVIKKGEKFSKGLAEVLGRMEIEPMSIGIDLRAAYEDGMVYGPDVLGVSMEVTLSQIAAAHQNALNLAINAEIYNKETVLYFLRDAHQKALNLSIEAEIPNKESIKILLGKASSQATALSALTSAGETPQAPATEEGEKKPAEEKEPKKAVAPAAEEAPEEKKEEAKAEEKAEAAKEKKEETKVEKKKEEKTDEDAAGGLGALFG